MFEFHKDKIKRDEEDFEEEQVMDAKVFKKRTTRYAFEENKLNAKEGMWKKVRRNNGLSNLSYVYDFENLIDFYERVRFTLPFMVYRAMKFWPVFDSIALYGHVISNGILMYIAINMSNSFYMCFNVLCVCMFYMISS